MSKKFLKFQPEGRTIRANLGGVRTSTSTQSLRNGGYFEKCFKTIKMKPIYSKFQKLFELP